MAQIEAKSWGVGVNVPEGRCVVNLDESALRMLEPTQHPPNPIQASYHSFKCKSNVCSLEAHMLKFRWWQITSNQNRLMFANPARFSPPIRRGWWKE
jgi:hypothetical protein